MTIKDTENLSRETADKLSQNTLITMGFVIKENVYGEKNQHLNIQLFFQK